MIYSFELSRAFDLKYLFSECVRVANFQTLHILFVGSNIKKQLYDRFTPPLLPDVRVFPFFFFLLTKSGHANTKICHTLIIAYHLL